MASNNKGLLLIENSICSDEIRIALSVNNHIIAFEQEFKHKKQLRGNIYIAYVKRIEPSLQAVFIEYGNNRQGFLSFSEISPEYFNIPEQEKQALFESDTNNQSIEENLVRSTPDLLDDQNHCNSTNELPLYKKYKLQDVILVNQKLLVQLTKEERSNKGASFTTYITLVGRYCVFMPNTMSKGGISRKIEDINIRKQLKEILNSIQLPQRSCLIIRTIGSGQDQKEIEKDFNYLSVLWENIQKNASRMEISSLIYNEADIVMKSVRDFCSKDIEVIVSGKEAFESIQHYVKNILQDHQLRCRLYRGLIPIFTYYGIENQISELYDNKVKLPSGGSVIISLTEALVAIDVNSGKMTGEESIEETAYKTNMEAVLEISRQVNLRGLSGLIVIDFIDMVRHQYCRAVESSMKQAFKNDKAKIQFSFINDFGLMVISRQRIKPNIQEINTIECIHCKGLGRVKSHEVIVASILRNLQYVAQKHHNKWFELIACGILISYIFNNNRDAITSIEKEYNVMLHITVDNTLDINTFFLRQGDNIHLDNCTPLQNSKYQVDSFNQHTEKTRCNIKSSFWLTKWLGRFFEL
ncbi:Rne/Rng family ribonuclease [Wolbachia endosymbiont of Howardula sp.]|uniref:Rne/Rng family ribonuclease n=1 Tax=Wolbachia endosymbiont of Howardula sp. TaxID=2916816 RepID=UPI00217D4E23|nr:Rne/Rng family ribonuclease [Wolbachia endosymbiont of Howardula sp.]UWI83122.1 Rne/Rng family ribonuclease [Wolbachia endosymbiont of Howardula sp.]